MNYWIFNIVLGFILVAVGVIGYLKSIVVVETVVEKEKTLTIIQVPGLKSQQWMEEVSHSDLGSKYRIVVKDKGR